jgi:hypothetical protein
VPEIAVPAFVMAVTLEFPEFATHAVPLPSIAIHFGELKPPPEYPTEFVTYDPVHPLVL